MLRTIEGYQKKTYVGYTNNLKSRLLKHNTNKGAKSTKGYKWKIIFKKKFLTRSKAMSYEYMLKKNRKKRLFVIKQKLDEK
jgi:putative endonuclease